LYTAVTTGGCGSHTKEQQFEFTFCVGGAQSRLSYAYNYPNPTARV